MKCSIPPTGYRAFGVSVGASGFEPPTSWSRTRRANRAALRPEHAPRRTRTPSLLIRSQALYPVELWALDNCGLSIADCGLGTWLAAGASRRANPQSTIRNPQSRHGRYYARTSDLHDVNVAI